LKVPNIAVGDTIGSGAFNLLILLEMLISFSWQCR